MSSTTTLQCPECHSPIEGLHDATGPIECKSCGASIPSGTAKPEAARSKFRISLGMILVSLVIVLLAAFTAGAALMAVRTAEERTKAKQEFAAAAAGLDQLTLLVCTSNELKGPNHDAERNALAKSLLDYYQGFTSKFELDRLMWSDVTAAHYRTAALKVKMGSNESVSSLVKATNLITAMRKAKFPPESFPSAQAGLFKLVTPAEWLKLQGPEAADMRTHLTALLVSMELYKGVLRDCDKDYPESSVFRDDLAASRRLVALINAITQIRNKEALTAWLEVRDLMTQLAREQPGNADYKSRLAESLTGAARLQRTLGDKDTAIASYEQAVQLREELAAANPEDKTAATDLKIVKRELEKLKPATASAPAPAAGAANTP